MRLAKTFQSGSSIETVELTLEHRGRAPSILLRCVAAGSPTALWKRRLALPGSGPSAKREAPCLLPAIPAFLAGNCGAVPIATRVVSEIQSNRDCSVLLVQES